MNIDSGDVAEWGFVAVVIAAVIFFFTLAVRSVAASGDVDFCWVQYQSPGYIVTNHRPWRQDFELARTATLPEAVQAAAATNCRLGRP